MPAILRTSTSMPMRARSPPASSTTLRASVSRLELRSSTVMVAVMPRRLPARISLIWRCNSLRSEVRKRCTAVWTASSADPMRTRPTASTLTGTPLLDKAFCRLMLDVERFEAHDVDALDARHAEPRAAADHLRGAASGEDGDLVGRHLDVVLHVDDRQCDEEQQRCNGCDDHDHQEGHGSGPFGCLRGRRLAASTETTRTASASTSEM